MALERRNGWRIPFGSFGREVGGNGPHSKRKHQRIYSTDCGDHLLAEQYEMLYDEQQGHDSLITGIAVDAVNFTVSVMLLSYATPDSPERVPTSIEFSNVKSVTMQADMLELANNRFAGTVAYWHIAEGAGTSHIHLVEGYLVVTAGSAPKLVRY